MIEAHQRIQGRNELTRRIKMGSEIPISGVIFEPNVEIKAPASNAETISRIFQPLTNFQDPNLNQEELSILRKLSEGKEYKEIAEAIGRSVKTIEARLTWNGPILPKLSAKSTLDATVLAIRGGLIELPRVNEENLKKIEQLSQKEVQIFSSIISPSNYGLTRKELARKLFVSEGSLDKYMQNIYSKIGVKGKVESVVFALNVKEKFVKDKESITPLIKDEFPSEIKLMMSEFNKLKISLKDKKALVTYYLWHIGKGNFDLVKKYLETSDKELINSMLERVLEDDTLNNVYEETGVIIGAASFIFRQFNPKDNRQERFSLILDRVRDLANQGLSDDEIRERAKDINKQVLGELDPFIPTEAKSGEKKTKKESTTVRAERLKAAFKTTIEQHVKQKGDTPIDLKALALRVDSPTYFTLLKYYHQLSAEQHVPPLKRNWKKGNVN